MIRTSEDHLRECMKDPEFKREYELLEPDGNLVDVLLNYCIDEGIDKTTLAKRLGVKRKVVEKIECFSGNPDLKLMKRIAEVTGTKLVLEYHKEE